MQRNEEIPASDIAALQTNGECVEGEISSCNIDANGYEFAPDRPHKKRKRESSPWSNQQNSDNIVIPDCIDDDRFILHNAPNKRRKVVEIKNHDRVRQEHTNSSVIDIGSGHQDICSGDEVMERDPLDMERDPLETVEDQDDCVLISENNNLHELDRKDPIVAAIIRANGTAIKHENHRDEWVDCLQWLNHVGLGRHCDILASKWEEDEIDYPTLKRLDHGDLVCSIGLSCFIAILCLL